MKLWASTIFLYSFIYTNEFSDLILPKIKFQALYQYFLSYCYHLRSIDTVKLHRTCICNCIIIDEN